MGLWRKSGRLQLEHEPVIAHAHSHPYSLQPCSIWTWLLAGNFSPSGSKKVKRTNINFLTSECMTMCLVLDKEIQEKITHVTTTLKHLLCLKLQPSLRMLSWTRTTPLTKWQDKVGSAFVYLYSWGPGEHIFLCLFWTPSVNMNNPMILLIY